MGFTRRNGRRDLRQAVVSSPKFASPQNRRIWLTPSVKHDQKSEACSQTHAADPSVQLKSSSATTSQAIHITHSSLGPPAACLLPQELQRSPKRPRLCAGVQPQERLCLPHPAAAHMLLQTACTPFDISLMDSSLKPDMPHDAHHGDDPASNTHGSGDSGNRAGRVVSAPVRCLSACANPASIAASADQQDILRACGEADAASSAGPATLEHVQNSASANTTDQKPSAAKADAQTTATASSARCGYQAQILAQPAIMVGYQRDWLETSPASLSMWQQVHRRSICLRLITCWHSILLRALWMTQLECVLD